MQFLINNDNCKFCEQPKDYQETASWVIWSKYQEKMNFYQTKVINDLMYNEPSHITSVFKDYLITDDRSEFLKRSYSEEEAHIRLKNFYAFYAQHSKVFPSYCVIDTWEFLFKNIRKKQKAINQKLEDLEYQDMPWDGSSDNLFDTRF